ncbi:hypothetical protein AB0E10_42465 [Streptomyces sp. NPDC048045]|uniref:hypothetical protein n=1 Tax=Streptomyces sp. NPDC048045 TaxID=3154710 RepID=UPI0034200A17
MIRQTIKSGLLATVALLAFLPAAAGAAPASAATTPRPAAAAAAQHPAQHPKHRNHHARRHTHRAHHRRLSYRHTRHLVAPGVARAAMQGLSYHRTRPVVGRVVTHRARLNVRSGPGTYYRVIGHRHAHRLLRVACKTYGSRVFGNHIWYRLPHHQGYVSARYVRTGRAVRWC